ncbi:aldo-keto reductase AKR2E4-like isoform X1 [Maniola hyperantus]|uniref:aldo-keto reductase AKR2E4-like isoform X1 n=2 Tax=Aphantopus hyperantus TaxID=2795564 RepID=UPI001568D195|nr:aldo-keto reductase AKR2E4-like [Maniola hyperantus]
MFSEVKNVKFNNGLEMPMVGLGTYSRKAEPGQFRQAVEWAIELGYRHIDTASSYKNEVEVGEGIANKINEGLVKREDLFVTNKLWNDSHAKDAVVETLKESLRKMKLDYLDLYLIHWPISVNANGVDTAISYLESWKGMEEAVKQGLAKSIGVSNFNEKQIQELCDNAAIKPVVNQIEISPTLTQHPLVNLCRKLSVIPVAYTPLGLISEARPEFIGKDAIKTDAKLGEIAKKYGKTRAQIALRYLIQREIPVIPKSFTKSRIEENLNVFDFELAEEEMAIVDGYNINHRCVPGKSFEKYTYYPF